MASRSGSPLRSCRPTVVFVLCGCGAVCVALEFAIEATSRPGVGCAAVAQNGCAPELVSEDLRAGLVVVCAAVAQNGCALKQEFTS